MPNDTNAAGSSSLLSTITRLLETNVTAGGGLDNIITVLALLCLFSIMNRNYAAKEPVQTQPAANTNPLHKLLGDLTKGSGDGGGGFSPEMLMSLLPLLNNPQLKSKINPSTIGTVMGLINNLSGGSAANDKAKPETKSEPAQEVPTQPQPPTAPVHHTAQPMPTDNAPAMQSNDAPDEDAENKNYGRYLNWKNNF